MKRFPKDASHASHVSLVNTEGRLYVLVHSHKPRAIVFASPIPELSGVGWTAAREAGIKVFYSNAWPRTYDELHPWLHKVIGNECRGRTHNKLMRNGKYTRFGGLVRLGYMGDLRRDPETGRPIVKGCFDTPLMDVDAVRVQDGRVVGLVELKAENERLTPFQRRVLKNACQMGMDYRMERSA